MNGRRRVGRYHKIAASPFFNYRKSRLVICGKCRKEYYIPARNKAEPLCRDCAEDAANETPK